MGWMSRKTRPRVSSLIWILLIIFGPLLYFVDVIQINSYSKMNPTWTLVRSSIEENRHVGFDINTPACKIPELDAFDEHIRQFIFTPPMPKCNNGTPALYQANLTSIYLLNSSLDAYEIADISELTCCYKVFWRRSPEPGEKDNKITYGKECYNFTKVAKINDEFIDVTCSYANATIYRDMFSFVPIKNISKLPIPNPRPPSVLIVGLDSVSRLNLHRQMPNTVNYLKEIKAIELRGYTKVADNTFSNLIPVLTGMFENELKDSCWPSSDDYFDNCPFVWKDYKRNGYVTAYGEDSSWMGLFNFHRQGFINQSTDYSYGYFNGESESKIGNSLNMNDVRECEGARFIYKDLLEYIKKFVITMDSQELPYFGLFWGASLSHDDLNKPSLGDLDYRQFFKSLKDDGHLENTALFFMSDHGIRWGLIRQTYQGRMEERLPFVITLLPDWYKNQYETAYVNLMINVRRLTTPFDLHETLVDLMNPFDLTDEHLEKVHQSRHGLSLFRKISDERTCEDAGIQSHWCTCQQSLEINTDLLDVINATYFVIDYINEELKGYAQCANLKLDAIINARTMTHGHQIDKGDNKIQDFMLTIRTLPGEAIFEVSVRYVPKEYRYRVIGTVSRLNLYRKQSSCITDFHLKLYCYCKNLLA